MHFLQKCFTGHNRCSLLEQNVGYLELGKQDSSWFYQQPKQRHDGGRLLPISGDQPFFNRLLIETSFDHMDSEENPSKLQKYLGNGNSGCKTRNGAQKNGRSIHVRL